MKKCDGCILNQLGLDFFKCEGDLKAPECIGVLQGAIEKLTTNRFIKEDVPDTPSVTCRVDYYINGEGSIYLHDIPTDEDVAMAIFEDCTEKEIGFEFLD